MPQVEIKLTISLMIATESIHVYLGVDTTTILSGEWVKTYDA